jgi:cell filamentation protein
VPQYGTAVLKNKLNLTDADELAAFEAEVSDARADEEAPAGDFRFMLLAGTAGLRQT